MGLAQRKVKQRIGPDPRNLSWGDDAARFGQAYLEKLGWSSGGGLGADGEGRASHITVKQKLNMLGIGADAAGMSGDPTIAWKQGKDFESVLAKLNTGSGSSTPVPTGFHAATAQVDTDATDSGEKKKKRKKDTDDDGDRKSKKSRSNSADEGETKEERKKRKEEKKRRKAEAAATSTSAAATPPPPSETPSRDDSPSVSASAPHVPRHRHHRAKFLRSKRMAVGDTAAMAQILGMSAPATPASTEDSTPQPPPDVQSQSQVLGIDDGLIKTSTKSVADYFKEKMEAKLRATAPASAATSLEDSVAPVVQVDSEPVPASGESQDAASVDEKEEKRRRKQEKKERKEKKRKEREAED
ncbi:hypothetical protein EXIGLDRAFT_839250 [Exidia glandulosa HHB12029]|uniref:G-patch domain-containing protein n=1 Tax=Exidia glandulosa HHB12029 TaxID=1314781 RepID=A0A165F4L4_EXIGL|nr:hypothetical protein EXIGLDRAFT_839250 [Exidia glandulosa HHB12029]